MSDKIQRIEYFYTIVPNKTGSGSKVFDVLKAEGVNLIAHIGFPICWGRAQLDFVPSDREKFLAATKKAGIKTVGPKTAFFIQGEDRVGAIADVLAKLKQAGISITALQAVSSGEGHYGAVLWVKPKYVAKTAQILGLS